MPAGALYLGSYHRLCQKAAVRLTPRKHIRILSGLHGLLNLDTVTAPYEMRLGELGSITADTVHEQAAAHGLLDTDDVIVLRSRLQPDRHRGLPTRPHSTRGLPRHRRTATTPRAHRCHRRGRYRCGRVASEVGMTQKRRSRAIDSNEDAARLDLWGQEC
ncbi:DUF6884 domain-containing protein [Rhodococcus sp. USK13]|uniref:DUF6884 domain-containing protein n=1 Tax=Rhodococcus sp. USK13 TaxID=2806442 RepID=UPI0032D57042